ncbi:MAG: hypothetical protein LBT46_11425 [Planctomycetaceae bacterium]|nr:hypothetical protein [Planctomycetaceae bacterium]
MNIHQTLPLYFAHFPPIVNRIIGYRQQHSLILPMTTEGSEPSSPNNG